MRTWVLLLTFLLVGPFLSAQEICSNGIDDDGDGLIDLNDKENCSCALSSTLTSLLPNPSLEDFDSGQIGCTSQQPGGRPDAVNQANCLTGWHRASLGTTDAWNAFTLTGAGPFFPTKIPLPLPSGTGVAGFWVGVHDSPDASFTNGDGTRTSQYREYLAACLVDGQRMEPGQPYRLTFSLGFMEPQLATDDSTVVDIRSPESVELSIYGVQECGQLNFGAFYSCPEASKATGYELIANVTVTGSAGNWTFKEVDFISPGSYAGFAIGGSCAPDNTRPDGGNYRNYYFIDDLILNKPASFAQPVAGPVQVDGLTVCEDITLTGQARTGATYQWFRNGVAIAGATSPVLEIPGGAGADGTYIMRVSTAQGCALTEPVVVQRPVLSDHFADAAAICGGQESVELRPRRFTGATFRWSDGSTGSSLTVTEAGTYSVTVNESCVEHTEEITVKKALPFTYSVIQEPAVACAGDTVAIHVSSNAFAPRYYFRDMTTGASLPATGGTLRVVAGEVEEILAFVGDDCGLESRILTVKSGIPFETPVAEIVPISCSGTGSISLAAGRGSAIVYDWRNATGESVGDGSSLLSVTRGGTFTVTLEDDTHCPLTLSYTVEELPAVTATVVVEEATCSRGGGIEVAAVSGTGPFRYRWFYNGAPDLLQENVAARTQLAAGSYAVEVTDARGCTYREDVEIAGGKPLNVTARATFADCTDTYSGMIEVNPSGGVWPYRFELAGYPAQSTPVFTGLAAGTYRVQVTDAMGCSSAAEVVTLEEVPVLDLGPDHHVSPGESVALELRDGPLDPAAGTLTWHPMPDAGCDGDCGSLTVSPRYTTEYRVSYTTLQGCTVTDYVTVHVADDPRVYVPNAFSPNGDGDNDEFRVYLGTGVGALTNLMVFDRWGELIWKRSDDRDEAWDGTFRGKPLSAGVFAYVGQVRLDNGTLLPLKGSVTLIE